MYVPIPALVAIAAVIALLLFLLVRGRSGDMLEQQRREAGLQARSSSKAAAQTRSSSKAVAQTKTPASPDLHHLLREPDIAEAIAKGKKIKAIKLVRERSGLGLKEAKELVDRGS